MTKPVIVMDEAGHTGENLLDTEQPVFSLAAIRIDPELAATAVSDALGRAAKTTSELKFSRLKRSNVGRKNLVKLLQDVDLGSRDAAVIEPRMLEKGLSFAWYGSGVAKEMAVTFYERAPRALGTQYVELANAFVSMVRDYTPNAAETFAIALRRAKIVSTDNKIDDLLAVMIDTVDEFREEFANREDALDPALTALFWQGGYWSEKLQTHFEIVHDDSKAVRHWQETVFGGIQEHNAERTETDSFDIGEVTIRMPTLLDNIEFATSHDDARVQVADVLAGAAAHVYAVAAGGRRDEGDFAKHLVRVGVSDVIEYAVGPLD